MYKLQKKTCHLLFIFTPSGGFLDKYNKLTVFAEEDVVVPNWLLLHRSFGLAILCPLLQAHANVIRNKF